MFAIKVVENKKENKKSVLIFSTLAMISLCVGIGVVAYNWGYMQCDIDNLITATSAPASVTIFTGIPFIVATIVFVVIAIVLQKKNNR